MVNLEDIKTEEDLSTLIMEKMFSYSPFKFSQDFCKEEGWFLKHEWSTQDEREFMIWMYQIYKNNYKIRKIDNTPNNSTAIQQGVDWFVGNVGWKTKED